MIKTLARNIILVVAFKVCLHSPVVKSWPYGQEKVRGVNIGGWLILEEWITPLLFQDLPETVVDEYTFIKHWNHPAADIKLRSHWENWFTEDDVIRLKNAGINHLRIPIGYWAFDIKPDEPWISGTWGYVMKAVRWAKKHEIQVMIDFHGAPGSQSGRDHSGRHGPINFFYSDENIERSVKIIGQIARIANSSEWRDTISIIQLLNEPILWGDEYHFRLGRLKDYYRQAYDEVRRHNSVVVVAIHDAFIKFENWEYLSDDPHYYSVMLDTHVYQAYTPAFFNLTCKQHARLPREISEWLPEANKKLWTVVGEWSLSTPMLCKNQADFAEQQIKTFEAASGWFFWNFKVGRGWQEWSFLASSDNGWINLKENNITRC